MTNLKLLFNEFKNFILKRSAVDMALGIILGVSFGKVVSSLVNDIITPPIGYILGGVSFPNLKIVLKEASKGCKNEVSINYGHFLQTVFDFLIVAFTAFLIIKFINQLVHKKEDDSVDWTQYIKK